KTTDAVGLVLATDLTSPEPLPSFANSSMDGYAVVATDVAAATRERPAVLHVSGEIAAGQGDLPEVAPGQAARIMTGAPLPRGADAVVPVEVTREQDGRVAVYRPSPSGEFVRTVGQDVAAGQPLLRQGHRIRPQDIGLLSALGISRVRVHPHPRVVVISTGDELVPSDRTPGPGQIRDSNGPMLGSLVRHAGGHPYLAGIVRDDRRKLMNAFDSNLGHADLVIATGGVSAGAYDHVQEVIGALGTVQGVKVAMQPGMPQVFGRIGAVPVLGLPGNPVSGFVSFEVFVRPVLRGMQGRRDRFRPSVEAVLTDDVRSPRDKRSFLRVRLRRKEGQWHATPTGSQGSHVLSSIVAADGLAEVPEDRTEVGAGDRLTVHLLVDA
ncbi:MAG TPA: gephyrin-like molybdotransferase Glp, partial [Nitriliruptorales bacterium]